MSFDLLDSRGVYLVGQNGAPASLTAMGRLGKLLQVGMSRLSELVVNVKGPPFNANGDGVTDDTAAIAAAINAAKASGAPRRVFFPAGTYLTDPITGLDANMIVEGCGRSSILKSRTGGNVLDITGRPDYLTLRDFAIEGHGQNGNGGHGIYAHDWTDAAPRHLRISDLHIKHCGGSGLRFGNGAIAEDQTVFSSMIENVHVEDCGDDLFYFTQWHPSNILANCYGERPLAGKFCFHIHSGSFLMLSCNGQDNTQAGQGGWLKVSSALTNGNVHGTAMLCNVEGFGPLGLQIYGAGDINLQQVTFLAGALDDNPVAIEVAYQARLHLDAVRFGTNGKPWADGYPIHVDRTDSRVIWRTPAPTDGKTVWLDDGDVAIGAIQNDASYAYGDEGPMQFANFDRLYVASLMMSAAGTPLLRFASAMPSTGFYGAGSFVMNTQMAEAGSGGNKYIVLGWSRIRSGTGHVLNTDWRECRSLTGN